MKKINLMILAVIVIVIAIANTAQADDQNKRSPLRGTWSFSQFVPSTILLNDPMLDDPPIPLVAVGNLIMDADNQFTGNGVFNTPVETLESIELDINGSCDARGGNIDDGLDCLFNFPGFEPATRYCVVMAKQRGRRCFDEFRCVNVSEPGQTVALIEFKRKRLGTCR